MCSIGVAVRQDLLSSGVCSTRPSVRRDPSCSWHVLFTFMECIIVSSSSQLNVRLGLIIASRGVPRDDADDAEGAAVSASSIHEAEPVIAAGRRARLLAGRGHQQPVASRIVSKYPSGRDHPGDIMRVDR